MEFPKTIQDLDSVLSQMKTKGATKEEAKVIVDEFKKRQSTQKKPTRQEEWLKQNPPKYPNTELSKGIASESAEYKRGLSQVGAKQATEALKSGDVAGWAGGMTKSFFDQMGSTAKDIKTHVTDPVGGAVIEGAKTVAQYSPYGAAERAGAALYEGDVLGAAGEIAKAPFAPLELITDKIGLTSSEDMQAQEKRIGGVLANVAEQTGATEAIKGITQWYDGLDQESKSRLTSLLDIMEVSGDIAGVAGVGKKITSQLGKEAVEQVAKKSTKEVVKKTVKETPSQVGVKNIEKILAPTTKIAKAQTQKIAPKLAREIPISTSRKSLLEKITDKAESAGRSIGELIDNGKLKGTIEKKKVLDVLDKTKKEFIVDGVDLDPVKTKAVENFQKVINKFPDDIPAETAVRIRRVFDKAVAGPKGGGFVLADEMIDFSKSIKKDATNVFRSELAKTNPDLAKLNAEFHLWETARDVLDKTVQRKVGQSGALKKGLQTIAGATIGGTTGGPLGAIGGATVMKWLGSAVDSTLWNTLSARMKTQIADMIIASNVKGINKIVGDINKTSGKEKLPLLTNPK